MAVRPRRDRLRLSGSYRSAGIDLSQLTVTEGGSRDALWNQIKADMLATEVVTLEVAGGAVPTNCLVAAYSQGDVTDLKEALQTNFIVKDTFSPQQSVTDYYQQQYGRRKKLLEALQASGI